MKKIIQIQPMLHWGNILLLDEDGDIFCGVVSNGKDSRVTKIVDLQKVTVDIKNLQEEIVGAEAFLQIKIPESCLVHLGDDYYAITHVYSSKDGLCEKCGKSIDENIKF